MNILSIYIAIPLLTLAAVILIRDIKRIWFVSASAMGLQVVLSAVLIFLFISGGRSGSGELSFVSDLTWFRSLNIHFITGVDWISVAMLAMTSLIFLSGIMATYGNTSIKKEFHILLILIVTGSNGFLISADIFSMFMFLGIAIIPFYFLFSIHGSGEKKSNATIHILMLMGGYTLLLVGILGTYISSVPDGNQITFNIREIANYLIPIQAQRVFFPMIFAGFAVIAGLFPFHLGLPRNLAAVPSAVPMLYSGVLMKLGAYGILRIAIYLMPSAAGELSWLLLPLAAITVIYGAVGTMLQKDMKQMIIYSSITCSGLILFALMLMNKAALSGAVLLMLFHGLLSALLFALSGMIISRYKTGLLNDQKGLLKTIPFLSVCYIFAILALAGLPGLSGSFAGVFQQPDVLSRILSIVIFSFFFPMAAWMIFRIAKVLIVPDQNTVFKHRGETGWHDRTSVIILIMPVIAFVVFPIWFSSGFDASIQQIINKIVAISPL